MLLIAHQQGHTVSNSVGSAGGFMFFMSSGTSRCIGFLFLFLGVLRWS